MKIFWVVFFLLTSATGLASDAYAVMRSIVKVETIGVKSQGSAVAVGPHVLVTNAHVVRSAKRVFVTVFGWDKAKRRIVDSYTLVGTVRASDPAKDLAIIDVPKVFNLSWSVFATDRELDIFDKVVAVGAGFGGGVVPYVGMVLDQDWDGKTVQDQNLIQTSCEIVPGCSGGGLFRKTGGRWYLLGIMSSGFMGTEMTFAIPISRVETFLKEQG